MCTWLCIGGEIFGQCPNYGWPPPIGQLGHFWKIQFNSIQNDQIESRSPWADIQKGIFVWENTKKRVFSSYFGLCLFWKKLRTENWLFFCPLYYYITFISSNNQTSQCDTNIFEYSNISHRILDIWIRIFNLLITNIFDIHIRPTC